MEGNGGALETRTSRQYQDMSIEQAVQTLQNQWQVANELVKTLVAQVQAGKIPQQQYYPLVPHTIASIVTGVFGFAPRGGFIEAELLSKAETLIGSNVRSHALA